MDKDHSDDFLYNQLDNLGQMIADGLADEPDGKWISQQYKNKGEIEEIKSNIKELKESVENIKTVLADFFHLRIS